MSGRPGRPGSRGVGARVSGRPRSSPPGPPVPAAAVTGCRKGWGSGRASRPRASASETAW